MPGPDTGAPVARIPREDVRPPVAGFRGDGRCSRLPEMVPHRVADRQRLGRGPLPVKFPRERCCPPSPPHRRT